MVEMRVNDDLKNRLRYVGGFDELAELCSESLSEIERLERTIDQLRYEVFVIAENCKVFAEDLFEKDSSEYEVMQRIREFSKKAIEDSYNVE